MSAVLTYGATLPVVRVGRIAGQFAKPRTAATEVVDGVELPSFRGHVVHSDAPTAEARVPDPERLVHGVLPGSVDAEPAPRLHEGRLRGSLARAHVEPRVRRGLALGPALRGARRRDRARTALHAGDRDRPRARAHAARGGRVDEPRGAPPRLRGAADAHGLADRGALRLLRAHALDRGSHARTRRRACRVLLGDPQPDRGQARADRDARRRRAARGAPQPRPDPGQAHADHAHGSRARPRPAAPAPERGSRGRDPRRLGVRSDAREHRANAVRHEDAALRLDHGRGAGVLRLASRGGDVARRRPHRVHRRRRHGVPRRLHEVLEEQLDHRYETLCDPRLNGRQSLDLAFRVAELMRAV